MQDRVVYHRQDLHEVLKAAATTNHGQGEPARIQTLSRVISCNCKNGSVQLENGDTLSSFDLIIGADGM
jgi:salicylate hydroxylase